MASKPKRPSPKASPRKVAAPPAAAARFIPPYDACWRCTSKDDCAFEGRCHAIEAKLPVTYSPAIAELLVSRLASGDNVTAICREPNMPSAKSVFIWLRTHPEFAAAYSLGRRWWADAQLERIIEVAADGKNDVIVDEATGKQRVDYDVIARSKLLVDTLKWAMSKAAPDKYGDRMIVETTEKPKTLDEMKAEIVGLLAAGRVKADPDADTRH